MIDLHCHTVRSDGEKSAIQLLEEAENLKLEYFSITDHNNCLAYNDLTNIKIDEHFSGFFISGCEFITSFENNIIEILGYGVDVEKVNDWNKKTYSKEVSQRNDIYTYSTLIKIFNKLGVKYSEKLSTDTTMHIKEKIYRDILSYEENEKIIGKEILNSYADFNMKGLNNSNSILFINENQLLPSVKEIVDFIHEIGGLAFLSHLYQYRVQNHIEFLNRLMKVTELDGIEAFHYSFLEEQSAKIINYANENKLYISGGSDYHGKLKPGVSLGTGLGNLNISKTIVEAWIDKIN